MGRGTRCEAHKHDAVVAQERHHLQPLSRGGLTVAANMRWLCANAHSDTHYLLDLIEDYARPMIGTPATPALPLREIPWKVMRTYGPGVRRAAEDGWMRYAEAFLRGDLARHVLIWKSDGTPRATPAGLHTHAPVPPYWLAEQTGMAYWLDRADMALRRMP